MLQEITVSLGGRVAEEEIFDDITTGASQDIKQATAIAKSMITKFGMSEKLGLIYPVKGRGNFVADSSQVQKINRESYRKEFTALIQKGRNTGFNREELEKMLAEIFEKEDES